MVHVTVKMNRKNRRQRRQLKDGDEQNVQENRRYRTVLRYNDFLIPDDYFCHFKYVESSLVLFNGGVAVLYAFAGNDLFDPNVTGTGHQPLGFDQMMALYKRFRVHSSKIKVSLVYQTQGTQMSITPSQSAAAPASMAVAMEQPYNKYTNWYAGIGTGAQLENDISTREITGIESINQDDQFAGSSTASPARLWYWVLNTEVFDGSTAGILRVNVCIDYYVELFDRVSLAQS